MVRELGLLRYLSRATPSDKARVVVSSRTIGTMKSVSVSQKTYSLLMFLLVSVVTGLLMAGIAVPFTAVAGGTTRMVADSMQYLPSELETPPQSERSEVLMADGSVLATFYDENRRYVPLSEIAPVMQDAQVIIEDHRFFEHGAIDPEGLARAVVRTLSGDTQGASTLTQQYVKLVRIENAHIKGDQEGVQEAQAVTIERKIQEMRYAMAIEERLTKQEILERYLNIAYYGDGAYGVEAAAHHYWGTSAKDLTLDQAAMLAGLVQNPIATNPAKHPEAAMERRDHVLNRMAELGSITQEEADKAKAVQFNPDGIQRLGNGCFSSEFPVLCDYVRRTLIYDNSLTSLGSTPEERENMLNRGGITVHTLINPQAQRSAEAAVAAQIAPTDPLLATTTLIQPKTGLIVAMAQSRPKLGDDPGETFYNYNVGQANNMGGAEGYQAGSTFKTFAMVTAISMGMPPTKRYDSPASMSYEGDVFQSCVGPSVYNESRPIQNYDRSYGMIDMRTAAEHSVNNYFVQLARDVGNCDIKTMAESLGLQFTADEQHQNELSAVPNMVLGTGEITPLSMTSAYATIANHGVHCNPIILESIITRDGEKIPVPDGDCRKVIEPKVADAVADILTSVMTAGTGRPARIPDGRPQAGKTGTTTSAEAVWFAGFTPDMAGSSMITIDKTSDFYKSNDTRSVRSPRLANGKRLAGTGGGDAGQMWKTAMQEALKDVPPTKFAEVDESVYQAEVIDVPDISGMGYDQAQQTLRDAGFSTVRRRVYSNRRSGTFLGIYPSDRAEKFSTISMQVSMGPRPAPPPPPPVENPGSNDGGNTQPGGQPGSAPDNDTPASAPPPANGGGNDDGGDADR